MGFLDRVIGLPECGRCLGHQREGEVFVLPSCCGRGANVLDGDTMCILHCRVQKVVVTRKRQPAPMLSWLTGHQEFLFVELAAGRQAVRTSSGSKLSSEERQPSAGFQETWLFSDGGEGKGEAVALKTLGSTELTLRVLGQHQDWSNAPVPLDAVGECRFQIDEDVLPAMQAGGLLSLPLLLDGRVRGTISLVVWASSEKGTPVLGPTSSRSSVPEDRLPVRGTADRLVRLKGHILPVTCCAVFPCGTRVLTASKDAVGIVWSTEGEQLAWLHGHSEGIVSCTIFSSGDRMITVAEHHMGIIWSSAGKQLATINSVGFCASFSSCDQLLAGIGTDGAAILSNSGVQLVTLKGHTGLVTSGALFPTEDMVVTGSKDEDAIIWSASGEKLCVLRGHSGAVAECHVFPRGDRVLTASEDKTAIIWASSVVGKQFGQKLAVLRGHMSGGLSCAIFPGGQQIVTVARDKAGAIWTHQGQQVAQLAGHDGAITGCAVLPKGDRVFTIAADKLAAIWNQDGSMLAELNGHSDVVRSCAVFPSGDHVVTTSDDMTAIIWPVATYVAANPRLRRV